MGTFAHDVIVVAEHEQTAECGMELTIFTAHHCRTNRTQETLVIKISPGTALTCRTETGAIRPHRIRIEIGNSEIVQHLGIHRLGSLISEHCRNLLPRATIVTFTAPAVGSRKEIVVDMHGTFVAWSTWNMNSHHHAIIRFEHFDFRFDGQHGAYLGSVADRIPKILTKVLHLGWRKPDCFEGTVFTFLDAEQNDAAIGVGEGGIGLPHTARETTFRGFRLNPIILTI